MGHRIAGQEQMHGAQDSIARAENGRKDGAIKDGIVRRRRNRTIVILERVMKILKLKHRESLMKR